MAICNVSGLSVNQPIVLRCSKAASCRAVYYTWVCTRNLEGQASDFSQEQLTGPLSLPRATSCFT